MSGSEEAGGLEEVTDRLREVARLLSEPGLADERVAELAAEAAELATRAGTALAAARDTARGAGEPQD